MAEKVSREDAEEQGLVSPPAEAGGGLPPEKALEILGTDPEIFETSQGQIKVGPMVMGQIARFMGAAEPLLPIIKAQATAGGAEFNVTKLISADPDAFFKAVAIASNTKVSVIENLSPDEFIKIVTKVFVVNLDFFVRTLPAALGMAQASVLHAVRKLSIPGGVEPFKNLYQMGTDSKISETTPSAK